MSLRLITCLVLISALALATAEKFRYDGYHVISVHIENEQQRELVDRLDTSLSEVHLLKSAAINHKAVLVVAPHHLSDVENMFSSEGLVHQVETTNLQKY